MPDYDQQIRSVLDSLPFGVAVDLPEGVTPEQAQAAVSALGTRPPTAWIRITKATLVCLCGHEQPCPDNHEGQPVQTCTKCGATWWTPCSADCEPLKSNT